jgi:hypothetical protein
MWGFSRRRQARPTFSSEAQVYDVICEDKIVGRIMLPRHLRPMGLDANLRKTLGKAERANAATQIDLSTVMSAPKSRSH